MNTDSASTQPSEIVSLADFYELASNGQDIIIDGQIVDSFPQLIAHTGDDYEHTTVEIIYSAREITIVKVIKNKA